MYKPSDYGAIGDGVHNDAPAINDMLNDIMLNEGSRALIDLSGSWYIQEPVFVRAPPNSKIIAGTFYAHESASLDTVLYINLGSNCRVREPFEVYGKPTSHLGARNTKDLVRIQNAQFCSFEGFTLGYASRYGLTNAVQTSSNLIGSDLGRIKLMFCGSAGAPNIPTHLKNAGTVRGIVRTGKAGSPLQRALLYVELTDLALLNKGDFLLINGTPKEGGHVVEVTQIGLEEIEVYPWPGNLQGIGAWSVDVISGGIKLVGGNTTQCSVKALLMQYSGSMHINSLYGCHLNQVTGEVVGSTLVLGSHNQAVLGTSVRGFHSEISSIDMLVASPTVTNTLVMSPVENLTPGKNAYQISPVLNDGKQVQRPWPITSLP